MDLTEKEKLKVCSPHTQTQHYGTVCMLLCRQSDFFGHSSSLDVDQKCSRLGSPANYWELVAVLDAS